MASIFRTATMTAGKKKSKIHLDRGLPNGAVGGRRHTMLPQQQPRDSVLSNGSSDRSSSVSDETFLSPPVSQDPGGYGLFGFDVEEQIREAWPIKCCFVVKEIMQTEIAYVQSLADIIKGYLTPLYSHLLNSGESANFIKTVFNNIVKIHQSHQDLMEQFQDTFSSPHDFASSFLHTDFLTLYSVYCTSFSRGNECLEKALHENFELREFLEHCQHVLGHSLPLSSQLIKPVQRILKYRLLLEELNKHFDQEHPACDTVRAALDKMATVAEQINTSFSGQKSSAKGLPSAVAKRRTNQVRDLQRSRVIRGRQASTLPLNSKLSQRSASETHLNTTHAHTLPNRSVAWAPSASESRILDDYAPTSLKPGGCEDKRGLVDSLPNVKQLKSYFEKLNKDGEEETRRQSIGQKPHPGGMRKSKSMAGTKRDSISMIGLGSPTKSPSWSPTKSPIKVPVLPTQMPSPTKSPTKVPVLPTQMPSPTKFPTKVPVFPTQTPSPNKSPTKVPVLPTQTPSPNKSPTKVPVLPTQTPSPNKSPLRALLISPTKTSPPKSPTKMLSILTPSKTQPPSESPKKERRKSSCGSLADLRVNVNTGCEHFIRMPPQPDSWVPTSLTSGPLGSNQAAKLTSGPLGSNQAAKLTSGPLGSNQAAKVVAANKISDEIKRHIEAIKARKGHPMVPRTMV